MSGRCATRLADERLLVMLRMRCGGTSCKAIGEVFGIGATAVSAQTNLARHADEAHEGRDLSLSYWKGRA